MFKYIFSLVCLAVTCPEDVVHRYKKLVKAFRKNRSLPATFKQFNIDRNTVAGTAIIADVIIAGEGGEFGELPNFQESQTLKSYVKDCKAFFDANPSLQAKITKMRQDRELLKITYKISK